MSLSPTSIANEEKNVRKHFADFLLPPTVPLVQIHANLMEREVHQHRFRGVSQYHAKRGEFVDWIKIVAEKFRLRETSAASAIAYLDRAMDFFEDRIRFFGKSQRWRLRGGGEHCVAPGKSNGQIGQIVCLFPPPLCCSDHFFG